MCITVCPAYLHRPWNQKRRQSCWQQLKRKRKQMSRMKMKRRRRRQADQSLPSWSWPTECERCPGSRGCAPIRLDLGTRQRSPPRLDWWANRCVCSTSCRQSPKRQSSRPPEWADDGRRRDWGRRRRKWSWWWWWSSKQWATVKTLVWRRLRGQLPVERWPATDSTLGRTQSQRRHFRWGHR